MKSDKNILIAFLLNLAFSIFEFFGGIYTGSVAILSDAIHDLGDAAGIGLSYFLEQKSKKSPDQAHSYGYGRYSVLGGAITSLILLIGSLTVIYNAVLRILNPAEIRYNGMILFALVGVSVNLCAAFFTRGGHSLNQKAVNLHMLEDVLGWIVVLLGALIMKLTNFVIIDPILSIGVALYILFHAAGHFKEVIHIFLEKTPHDIDPAELLEHLSHIEGVIEVHHLHIWSLDGHNHCATLHIVTDADPHTVKDLVREELREHHIPHATLELEASTDHCHHRTCRTTPHTPTCHHHHHH